MSEEKQKLLPDGSEPREKSGGTSTMERPKTTPQRKGPGMMPQWRVLLHNDDKNDFDHVILTIMELTPLNEQDAELKAKEADKTGVSLLLITHKERAELYVDQFQSKSLTVTIEPAE